MSDENAELVISNEGHIRVLRLNRPERRNALSESLKLELIEDLEFR